MTSEKHNKIVDSTTHPNLENWFDALFNELEVDKFLLKEDLASEETKRTYNILMSNNQNDVFRLTRDTSSMYFIQNMIIDYFREIKKSKVSLNQLAFDLGNSKLLTWAEIETGDEASEDKLIMAEARINAKYDEYGFHLTTTIIEQCDNIPVPTHYNSVNLTAK